jgi:hypothetical protein
LTLFQGLGLLATILSILYVQLGPVLLNKENAKAGSQA